MALLGLIKTIDVGDEKPILCVQLNDNTMNQLIYHFEDLYHVSLRFPSHPDATFGGLVEVVMPFLTIK